MTKCNICSQELLKFAENKIMNKYDICFFQCPNCGFVQTEYPHWLDEAYSQEITSSDIGLASRNIQLARFTKIIITLFFKGNLKFLDYGGGYGLFVRLMRDAGFNFFLWDKYPTINIFAKNYEANIDEQTYELVTAFEVFEHFVDPMKSIEHILSLSDSVLFSTQILPENTPQPDEWWYYGLEHGQHISFYTQETLSYIAKVFGINFYTNGTSLHLFTKKNISNNLFRLVVHNKLALFLGFFSVQSLRCDM